MTSTEFQRRYHNYKTDSGDNARNEADKANQEGIDGDEAVAVDFGTLGWCLMLRSAAELMIQIGVLQSI